MRHPAFLALWIVAAATSTTLAAAPTYDARLHPLAFLVGQWRAPDGQGGEVRAVYRFTAGGTSLMETLTFAARPEMITMYHADGSHLALTHYCSLGNQPRMRAKPYHDGDKTMSFFFVDATNLAKQAEAHMRQVTFDFLDEDHVTQTWITIEGGKETPSTFKFERVNDRRPSAGPR